MTEPVITVVHSFEIKPDIRLLPSAYASRGTVYFLPEHGPNQLDIVTSSRKFELERNDWIRKYDNLLNGVRYWQSRVKALESK